MAFSNKPLKLIIQKKVDRVVFVTGKHYYAVAKHAEESGLCNVAFVRLEQLCPFPTKELQEAVAPFKRAKSEFQNN